MTALFDRAFVALGVDAQELTGVKGRSALYLGLVALAAANTVLLGGICRNLLPGFLA